jgi:hypothetical protein
VWTFDAIAAGSHARTAAGTEGQNGSMFKVLLPFLYVLSTEYSVVFSGFLDTVLDMYNMIDWLSTGGVVAYTILGSPCLKTSERQGAPGPDPESATRGIFASGRKIQKNVNIDKFPIFTAKSRSKKKKKLKSLTKYHVSTIPG